MQLPNGFDSLCNFIASVKIFQKHCWSQYMSYFCKKYVGRGYISYTCVWNVGSHTRISTCILFKSLTKKWRQENALSDTWLKKSLTEKWNSVMVFCFQNCSDLQWDKIVLVIEKTFGNSRLKAENHWSNLFKQWKVRTIFETECISRQI